MNKINTLFLLFFWWSMVTLAQSPQSFKYQAIARVSGGPPITTLVSFRIGILEGSLSGDTVYQESHSVVPNSNGLVNLDIGGGMVISGDFATLDWGGESHFVQIEMDELGGTSYSLMGVTQLLSVPYALHSQHSHTVEIDQVDDEDADSTNEIQILSISNDTVFLTSGGFVVIPGNDAYSIPAISRGGLPIGASCSAGGNYTASSSTLAPGMYMYTLYSCPGQIGQIGGGFNVNVVFLSGTGDASNTWRDFNSGSCGNYYTGIVRVSSVANVAVRYMSSSGSSFLVPGANAEGVRYFKIN